MKPDRTITKDRQAFPDEGRLLEKVLECSYDGIYITDGEANTLMVNHSYEGISGLRREDLLGRNLRELVASGIVSESGTLLAIRNRGPVTLEQRFKTGKHALISSVPAFDEKGEITLVVTNVRDITEIYNLKEQLSREHGYTDRQVDEMVAVREKAAKQGELIATDWKTLAALVAADKIARVDACVLLLGEIGVGKETFARYIHNNSARCGGEFVRVDCTALPPVQLEEELFGGDEGKPCSFDAAAGGTLYLDEVGALPGGIQTRLLRIMQEKAPPPVRIIASTAVELEQEVEEGRFRRDLYYRLGAFPIAVPPLRERRGDILPLAQAFLRTMNIRYHQDRELSQSAVMELQLYSWPGNIHEMRNVVERAVILSADGLIRSADLAIRLGQAESAEDTPSVDLKQILENLEKHYIHEAFEKHGNVRKAARSLNMDAATYIRRRKKYFDDDEDCGPDPAADA